MASNKLSGGRLSLEDSTANRPGKRQRIHKAPPALEVPDINRDAAERKRVLNVLAQRRYRERKRQSQKAASVPGEGLQGAAATSQHRHEGDNIVELEREDLAQSARPATLSEPAATSSAARCEDNSTAVDWNLDASAYVIPDFGICIADTDDTPHLQLPSQEYSSSPCSSSMQSLSALNPMSLQGFDSSTSSSSPLSASETSMSFPDSYLLPVIEMTLLRAFLRIADRLGSRSTMWDITAISPFTNPSIPTPPLPQTWQPTTAQILVPHHPFLDFLPWPSVREKIISLFKLPEEMRPPAARSPTALVQFAYDVEDGAEGIRIWGDDIFDPTCWEVGQALFERWWFIFDRAVIEQSNAWRQLRGADKLRITAAGT